MPRPLLRALLAGAALPALTSVPLWAQETQLDPVILQAASDEPGEAAGSTTLTEEEIEAASTGTLSDLFRSTPEVTVGGGIAVTEKVFVNGVDQQQLAVSVDGVAQNNRLFHHLGANVVDPGLLKAVEVDAGVAPADAGPGALGGAIRFETKDARDLLADGRSFGGKLTFGFVDNGDTASTALTLYGAQGPVDALLYVKRATGDAYEDGDGSVINGTGADLSSGMIKVGAEANGWRAEYSAMKVQDEALRPYRANVGGVIGGAPVPELRLYGVEQTTQALTFSRVDGEGMIDPELQIAHSGTKLNIPEPYGSTGDADALSVTAKNTFHFDNGLKLTAGLDYQDREGSYAEPGYFVSEAVKNTGLFVQGRGTVGQVDYSAGLRYDWNRFDGVNGQEINSNGASANASATWHASEALSFNAGFANTFGGMALANAFDMYRFSAAGAYDALASSRAKNAVLGTKWQQNGITLGAEIFHTEIDNARTKAATAELVSKGYRLSAGYEWQAGHAMLRFADADVSLNGAGASTYDLLDLGTPPGRLLSLEVSHEVSPGLTMGGVVQKAFDLSHQGSDTDQDFAGYTTVDVFAEYQPSNMENLVIRAEVTNLFDQAYIDRASYGGDYSTVIGQQEPGRAIALTMNYTF